MITTFLVRYSSSSSVVSVPDLGRSPAWLTRSPNTGESYGGRFIPNIANHILTTQADINLKGLVIGNGVCDCSGDYCYGEDHSFQLYNSDHQLFLHKHTQHSVRQALELLTFLVKSSF